MADTVDEKHTFLIVLMLFYFLKKKIIKLKKRYYANSKLVKLHNFLKLSFTYIWLRNHFQSLNIPQTGIKLIYGSKNES